MEEQKSSVSWSAIAVFAAIAVAIVALALDWNTRTELRKEIAAIAVLQLRSAALSSLPYRDELDLVRRLTSGDQSLHGSFTSLAKFQDTGIPNLTMLSDQLEQTAAAALVEEQSRPELGIFDALASRIAATAVAVGLRAGSNPLNSELAPVMVTAEKSLSEGLIDQTIAAINNLPPDLVGHFAAWNATAEGRKEAVQSLDELTDKLVMDGEPVK